MEIKDESPSLSEFRNLFYFGFFNLNSWLIALGTPMVVLAGALGASAFQIGLAYAFVFLLLPVQIIATATLHHFGYKRQMIFGWTMRAVFLIIPITLVSLRPENPSTIHIAALLSFVFLFAFFRSIGSCAVMPWYYTLLPDQIRGKFFSYDQSFYAIAGVLTLIYCALLFKWLPLYDAFLWQYVTCAAASFISIYFLSKVPDVPKPEPTNLKTILKVSPSYCFEKSPFRQYLIFIGSYNIVQTALIPLITYYLQIEIGLDLTTIMYLTAFQYVGAITGAQLLGRRVDRVGVKPTFRISLLINIGVLCFWFFHSRGVSFLSHALYPAYFLFGATSAAWATANLKYLPRVCIDKTQALAVSIHSSVVGLIAGLSPMFWGFFVKKQGGAPGVYSIPFSLFFIAAILVSIVLYIYTPKLTSEGRNLPALQIGSHLLRPYRYFGNLASIGMMKIPKTPKR